MRPNATAFATCFAALCTASIGWGQAEISVPNPLGLGWTACSVPNPVGVYNFSFMCETETVNACRVLRLLPTFVSTINDPAFAGSTTTIEARIGSSPTVGQWWAGFVPGGCRSTSAISTVGNITATSLPTLGACRNLYPPGAATLPGQLISGNFGGRPNSFRISSANSVYPTQPLVAGERLYAMQLEFKTEGTLADCDPAVDPTPVCTQGCLCAACLILHEVSIFMEVGTGNPNPDIIHYSSDGGATRQFATYQGGTGGNCPGASPVRSVTWGAVKGLYR